MYFSIDERRREGEREGEKRGERGRERGGERETDARRPGKFVAQFFFFNSCIPLFIYLLTFASSLL